MEDGGTAIFSQWPIRERREIMFDTRCNMDGYANKGFVYVRLDVDGTPVHVIGTHMQADPSNLGPLIGRSPRSGPARRRRTIPTARPVPAKARRRIKRCGWTS